MLVSSLLSDLKAGLVAAGFPAEAAGREARLILQHAANLTAADLLARGDTYPLGADQVTAAQNMAARRAGGEPLSRIKGFREFYGLDFALSPDTLDPRPETELIVDAGLRFLRGISLSHREREGPLILDLGTGTGCIPISLLTQIPGAHAVAVDISQGALEVAAGNAARHSVADRLTLIQSNWADSVPKGQTYDLITANPPYIPSGDIEGLMPEVRGHDPIRALDGGADGLGPYHILFPAVRMLLKSHGLALFEMGAGQAEDLTRLTAKYRLDVMGVLDDDAGIPRVMAVVTAR